MKTITDLFAKHIGVKEYNGIMATMLKWYYGELRKMPIASTGTVTSLTMNNVSKTPDSNGVIDLGTVITSLPTIPSITLNGSSTTLPSFYAPTSAGTSGYYLKSNGSGAPTWTSFPTIPSASVSAASAVGTIATSGSASTWSRSDHVHNITDETIKSALGYTPGQGQTTAQIVRW